LTSAAHHNDASPDARNVVSGAVDALLERVRGLTGLITAVLTERHDPNQAAASVQPVSSEDAQAAWQQLREHPHLLWIPPVWRTRLDSAEAAAVARRQAVSAIERNLTIDMGHDDRGEPWVRLATGALQDRPTSHGVDPTIAAGSVDPKLDVKAPSFPEAVVRLRDALIENYGEPSTTATVSGLNPAWP
jgi:hypothetical protein